MVSLWPWNYIIVETEYYNRNPTADYENLQVFVRLFWIVASNVIAFSVGIKFTIIDAIDIILMSLGNNLKNQMLSPGGIL